MRIQKDRINHRDVAMTFGWMTVLAGGSVAIVWLMGLEEVRIHLELAALVLFVTGAALIFVIVQRHKRNTELANLTALLSKITDSRDYSLRDGLNADASEAGVHLATALNRLLDHVEAQLAGLHRQMEQRSNELEKLSEEYRLAPGIRDDGDVAAVARQVLRVARQDFLVQDQPIKITVSIGGAIFPDDLVSLKRNADIAMYRAKEGERIGWKSFRPPCVQRRCSASSCKRPTRRDQQARVDSLFSAQDRRAALTGHRLRSVGTLAPSKARLPKSGAVRALRRGEWPGSCHGPLHS
ncbi:diguanylate cyclase [Proteobacteria bacterium 005FR1]|nr:diguanylate cyclase [Proteobacteria bacterium 005FR1]